jgi:hypothetical protein
VPDLIKCLCYIQKGCRAILVRFDCFVNLVHYSLYLLNGVDKSQVGDQVELVGLQLWGEVCCGEVSRRLFKRVWRRLIWR